MAHTTHLKLPWLTVAIITISDLSLKKPVWSQKVIDIQEVSVCYVWERRGMGNAPAHGLRTSKWMRLEVVLSDSSGCHHAVLLHHTCGGIPTLSCCLHNQNILQNPHIAEVLPNNWINQGQRWTSHVTLSASKLTQNYNNPSPPEKLILCIPHVSRSLHQSGNTTSNNQ